jgi:hypothetical protein
MFSCLKTRSAPACPQFLPSTLMQLTALCCLIAMAAICTAVSANPVIRAFSGGDPGEGLDMEGAFVYAVDVGDPATTLGGQTILDATFTSEGATPGATVMSNNIDSAIVEFGNTPDDNALESLVSTGRWAGGAATDDLTVDLDVDPGQTYVLQLMFVEGWNSTAVDIRRFDIDVEGVNLATDFDITSVTGPQQLNRAVTPQVLTPNPMGAVFEYMLTAADNEINVVLSHGASDNPRLEAFTLKFFDPNAVPVPGDVNGDRVVDNADFDIIRGNFLLSATTRQEGDLNRDGLVEFADFRIWKDNVPAGVGSLADIPEPGTLILAECALFVGILRLSLSRRYRARAVEPSKPTSI